MRTKQETKENLADYRSLLQSKSQLTGNFGFQPLFIPDACFPFQTALIQFALRKGRSAIFADCGLGKTLIELVWAENVCAETNGRVLILTPLAVSGQTVREGQKFGIEVQRSERGELPCQIVVTNYERLHLFNSDDFKGVVCDESSILKNFDGSTRNAIVEFTRKTPYRLLCTATAAPNDYIELGNSSEALGYLGFMDMIGRFFKKCESTTSRSDELRSGTYRFRGHAENDFWRWVCSWSRAVRMPSDLGFDNNGFVLPKLDVRQHIVEVKSKNEEYLFEMPAVGLAEQRKERSRTVQERCEMAAELANGEDTPFVCWCHLNREGDLLEKLIPDSVQVSGSDPDDLKEERLEAFTSGKVRVLVTKPTIAGFGLNWQHCHRQTYFPSHSFEQWYQSVRRSWRFGQKHEVKVDVITSPGEADIVANMQRKAAASETLFESIVQRMKKELNIVTADNHTKKGTVPSWM